MFHNARYYIFMHFLYLVMFFKVATRGGRGFGPCFDVFQGRLSAHRASHCHLVVQEVMKPDTTYDEFIKNTVEPSLSLLSRNMYIYI